MTEKWFGWGEWKDFEKTPGVTFGRVCWNFHKKIHQIFKPMHETLWTEDVFHVFLTPRLVLLWPWAQGALLHSCGVAMRLGPCNSWEASRKQFEGYWLDMLWTLVRYIAHVCSCINTRSLMRNKFVGTASCLLLGKMILPVWFLRTCVQILHLHRYGARTCKNVVWSFLFYVHRMPGNYIDWFLHGIHIL